MFPERIMSHQPPPVWRSLSPPDFFSFFLFVTLFLRLLHLLQAFALGPGGFRVYLLSLLLYVGLGRGLGCHAILNEAYRVER